MRYCSACGHEFKDEGIDAHMEIPGVNVELYERMINRIGRCKRT